MQIFAAHCTVPYLRWVGCSEAVARVSFQSAASWVFEGREYFSCEAVEGNTGGLAMGDGGVVVLGGRGQVRQDIARHFSPSLTGGAAGAGEGLPQLPRGRSQPGA